MFWLNPEVVQSKGDPVQDRGPRKDVISFTCEFAPRLRTLHPQL